MMTWKPLFTQSALFVASSLVCLSHAHAGSACNFSLVEDEVKNAAEEMVTAGMEQLLDTTAIEYDEDRIEVTSHWKPIPYSIQGLDGRPFSGENISLIVLAKIRAKNGHTYKMSALNLFSAGVRKVSTNADVEGQTQPQHENCVIDFSRKGKNPILLINLKTGHSIGKVPLPTSNSVLNVKKTLNLE
jgi:hypothetical protein